MTIDSFAGPFAFLSNFSPAPVVLDGVTYPTVEHAYQPAKTIDLTERDIVRSAATAAKAKGAGRRVTKRPDWEAVRLSVMLDLLRQKFAPGSALAAQLIATGTRELIEGNYWHDYFWGVCNGRGENHLGRLLMSVRHELTSTITERKAPCPVQ